jgi:hypothetical protein
MKCLAIAAGVLFAAAVLHRMRRAHYERWMDVDA